MLKHKKCQQTVERSESPIKKQFLKIISIETQEATAKMCDQWGEASWNDIFYAFCVDLCSFFRVVCLSLEFWIL